jgi:hypothetical protein
MGKCSQIGIANFSEGDGRLLFQGTKVRQRKAMKSLDNDNRQINGDSNGYSPDRILKYYRHANLPSRLHLSALYVLCRTECDIDEKPFPVQRWIQLDSRYIFLK